MKKSKLKTLDILYYLGIILTLYSFVFSFNIPILYTESSLYKRIIAARVLQSHLDPYYFEWDKNYPPQFFYAYQNVENTVNPIYDTPTTILLFIPLSKLNYTLIKIVWHILEWILLFLSMYLLSKSTKDHFKSKLILIINLLIFPISAMWGLHLIKGGIYILYLFLIILSYYLLRYSNSIKIILAGFILGFLPTLYPISIIMLIPFIVIKKIRIYIGYIIGFVTGISLPIIFFENKIWLSFFSAFKYNWQTFFNEPYKEIISLSNTNLLEKLLNFIPVTKTVNSMNYSVSYILFKYFNKKLPLIFFIILIFILLIVIIKREKSLTKMYFVSILSLFIINLFFRFPIYMYYNIIFFPILSFYILGHEYGQEKTLS